MSEEDGNGNKNRPKSRMEFHNMLNDMLCYEQMRIPQSRHRQNTDRQTRQTHKVVITFGKQVKRATFTFLLHIE